MRLIIFALPALLSFVVNGSPTNTSDLANAKLDNATSISDFAAANNTSSLSFNPNQACWWAGTDMTEMPGDCRCWHGGSSYHRAYYIEAIDKACQRFAGGVGEPVSVYGLGPGLSQGRTSFYDYFEPIAIETLHIAAVVQVWQDFDHCMGPLPVSRQYCWDSLRATVDACNTGGEGGKHGGYLKWGCLTWILDPDPSMRWPYTGIV